MIQDSTLYRRVRSDGTVEQAIRVPAGDNHSRAWAAVTSGEVLAHVPWGSTEAGLV